MIFLKAQLACTVWWLWLVLCVCVVVFCFVFSLKEGERFQNIGAEAHCPEVWDVRVIHTEGKQGKRRWPAACICENHLQSGQVCKPGQGPPSLASGSLGAKRREGRELQNARPASHPVCPPAFASGDSGGDAGLGQGGPRTAILWLRMTSPRAVRVPGLALISSALRVSAHWLAVTLGRCCGYPRLPQTGNGPRDVPTVTPSRRKGRAQVCRQASGCPGGSEPLGHTALWDTKVAPFTQLGGRFRCGLFLFCFFLFNLGHHLGSSFH